MATVRAATAPPAVARRTLRRRTSPVTYRAGERRDAPVLHALITAHLDEGRLLPRASDELEVHAPRFVVALRRGRLVGCAELAPLSGRVAEIRSLVVDRGARSLGIGARLVEELRQRARLDGYDALCAFAHDAAYFVRMGFTLVPHTWVPEKIARDCRSCAQFRRCGQHAVMQPLADPRHPRLDTFVPLSSLRG